MPDGMPLHRPSLEADAAESGQRLRRFVRMLWEGWPILLGGAVLGLMLSVTALRLVTPQYTAVMVIGPTARVGAAAMGARLPVLIGREAAAAASEPGPGDEILSDFARYCEETDGLRYWASGFGGIFGDNLGRRDVGNPTSAPPRGACSSNHPSHRFALRLRRMV